MSNYTQERLEFIDATIASGQTVSDSIDLIGKVAVAIITPAALTGTTIDFKISNDGTTFYDYYNTSGTQLSVTVSTSRWIGFIPADFANVRFLKLVSGSAEGAERVIKVVARGM